jgi:hypothetical protein
MRAPASGLAANWPVHNCDLAHLQRLPVQPRFCALIHTCAGAPHRAICAGSLSRSGATVMPGLPLRLLG